MTKAETVSCKKCHGSGQHRGGEKCKVCKGAGKVLVTKDKEDRMIVTPVQDASRKQGG